MKIFTSNDFNGIWPVPTAAVIVANSEDDARQLLIDELKKIKSNKYSGDFTLIEVIPDSEKVIMLSDGEY